MSVQDNLLNEKNIVLEQPETETEKNNQMCSFNSDEMEDMCYFRQDDACGEHIFPYCKSGYGSITINTLHVHPLLITCGEAWPLL